MTEKEVLMAGPARSAVFFAGRLFDTLKDFNARGISIRYITEKTEFNSSDLKLLSKYCHLRNHPNLSIVLSIRDGKYGNISGSPSLLTSGNKDYEPSFLFEDPSFCSSLAELFEALWNESKEIKFDS